MRKPFAVTMVLLLALAGVLTLLCLLTSPLAPVRADPGTLYVAPGGDCGGMTPCYAAIQDAVDAASNGDTIQVAQGVYTSTGFQVVYINKAITLTGGYTTTDWVNSYPLTRPTVIDAENVAGRRGVYIDGTGVTTITLAGLTIQQGYAQDARGGGVYVLTGTVVLQDSRVLNNQASGNCGGGVSVTGGTVTLSDNTFQGNSGYHGGAVYMRFDNTVTLSGNTFQGNLAYCGGGVDVGGGTVTLNGNTFQGNSTHYGGGVYVEGGTVTLRGNTILGNTADSYSGGGVYLERGTVTLSGNTILSNTANPYGGGVYVHSGVVTLSSNTILSNTANSSGGGIAIAGGTVDARNDIVASNTSPWEGVYLSGGNLSARHWTLANNGNYALRVNGGSAALTNTIVASHTLGGLWGVNINADHTFFFNSGTACSGGAVCTNTLTGDPHFANPAAGDYHIGSGSAAIDAGVDAGVADDIDGDPRPLRSGFDVGADEFPYPPVASFASSSPDWVGQETTFTNTTVVTSAVASYLWTLGDGAFSTAVSPTHAYTAPGDYTVVLTATNPAGQSVATGTVTLYAAAFASSSPDWLGQATVFTNTTATSGTTTYLWSFGDGMTGTQESPMHTYTTPGIHTVVLTATNADGSGVATGTVVIYGSPDAAFTTSSPDWLGQTTVFTNTTTTTPPGDPTVTYLWTFGDDGTSAEATPAHVYAGPGLYTVVLTATNAAGSAVTTNTVTAYSVPAVTFTTSGPDWLGQPTTFTATASTTPPGDTSVSFTWDFGDASPPASGSSVTHTYTSPGIHTVILTATNAAGNGVATDTVAIYAAAFTSSSPDWLGQVTTFTNTTFTGGATTYEWAFGDDAFSTEGSPTHTYTLPGLYTVVLTATSAEGSGVAMGTVALYGQPSVTFTNSSPDWLGQATAFTATVTTTPPGDPSVSLTWDFGDSSPVASAVSVTHTYASPGDYTVILTATNPVGQDVVSDTVTIYAPPDAAFTSSSPDWLGQVTVFTNVTTGPEPITYAWDFGDGTTGTLKNPSHAYTAPGDHIVVLTATNPSGSDAVTATVVISAPVARFSSEVFDVDEDVGTATVTATLDVASEITVTVDYATGDGSAVSDSDYTPVSGTLSFAPGQVDQTFGVPIINDTLDEMTETVALTLSDPHNATLGAPDSAILAIVDDDVPPTVQFSHSDYNVDESTGSAAVTVTLSAPSGLTVTVDCATDDGTASAGDDYAAVSSTLTFGPGQTSRTCGVPIYDDALHEPDETVLLALSAPSNATLGTPIAAALTIADNDPLVCPPQNPGDPVSVSVNTSAGIVQVTFHDVITCGVLAVTATVASPASPPNGFTLLATHFDATAQDIVFSTATLCFPYRDAEVAAAGVPEASLRLLHFENGAWKDTTTSLDTVVNVICGEVEAFSPFVLGVRDVSTCAISINNGAVYTGKRQVQVFSNTSGAAQMLVSNDASFAGATWQPYQSNLAWTLSDPGQRIVTLIVYARLRDAGNDPLCSGLSLLDDIVYDPLAPTVAIAAEAMSGLSAAARLRATATSVTVRLTAADQAGGSGVAEMQVSANGSFVGAKWQPFHSTAQIAAQPGQTIYARVRDGAGNVSAVASSVVPYHVYLPLVLR